MKATIQVQWLTIENASARLDITPDALRRRLERVARRGPDGTIEAKVDGLTGRKLGRSWRVRLSERWLATADGDGATLGSSRASTAKEK